MDNHLKEEFQEYQKEKAAISEILRNAEGRNNSQRRVISAIFALLILGILVAGFILHRLTLIQALDIATLLAVLKVIWMFRDLEKSTHFEFWLLNSLEFRLNEIEKRIKRIEKMVQKEDEK